MDVGDSGVSRLGQRSAFIIFGIALACLTLSGTAAAATLKSTFSQIDYDAIAGEANKLVVVRSGDDYVFTETGGVPITPTAPCVTLLANSATCPVTGITSIDISLLDLDDSAGYDASIVGPPITRVGVDGGPGLDTMAADGTAPSQFIGREGADTFAGGDESDDVRVGEGDDIVDTGGGGDGINDGPGADTIVAGPGNDSINDKEVADPGDVLDFGPGLGDRLDSRVRTNGMNISLDGAANDGEPGEADNITGLENIDGGEGADTFTGSGAPEYFAGNDGNDILNGGAGPDLLEGGTGDDQLEGGSGADAVNGRGGSDLVNGGDGDDQFSGEFFDDGTDTISGGPGTDTISGIGDYLGRAVTIDLDGVADDGPTVAVTGIPRDNAGADIENLLMTIPGEGGSELISAAADALTGNDSANEIDGGGGNDRISGSGGADNLVGGPGDDQIDGGSGIDQLQGNGGSDVLRSRDSNADEVTCGSASDVLLADSLDDFTVTCDLSSTGAKLSTPSAKLKKGKASVRVFCPVVEGIDCGVTISATKGKKVLAKGSGQVKSGKTGIVKLKLTGAGRKSRSKKLALRAKTIMIDASGAKVTTTKPKLVLSR
jgi:Ca2+-binding RTX toxin-like protein